MEARGGSTVFSFDISLAASITDIVFTSIIVI